MVVFVLSLTALCVGSLCCLELCKRGRVEEAVSTQERKKRIYYKGTTSLSSLPLPSRTLPLPVCLTLQLQAHSFSERKDLAALLEEKTKEIESYPPLPINNTRYSFHTITHVGIHTKPVASLIVYLYGE